VEGLLIDEGGYRMSYDALWNRFNKAREAAGVSFQFKDLRAKAATDTGDLAAAQKLLGHKSRAMTEHYTRNRLGERVNPVMFPMMQGAGV
jgi:integrase